MGITKNLQTRETITRMAKKAFQQKEVVAVTELTEGAYREYEDDGQYQWVKPLFEASGNELQHII